MKLPCVALWSGGCDKSRPGAAADSNVIVCRALLELAENALFFEKRLRFFQRAEGRGAYIVRKEAGGVICGKFYSRCSSSSSATGHNHRGEGLLVFLRCTR